MLTDCGTDDCFVLSVSSVKSVAKNLFGCGLAALGLLWQLFFSAFSTSAAIALSGQGRLGYLLPIDHPHTHLPLFAGECQTGLRRNVL